MVATAVIETDTAMAPAATSTPDRTDTPALTPAEATATLTAANLTPGNWHDMVYHAALGKVVLVNGGPETGKPADEPAALWTWAGTGWQLAAADPAGPRWRNFAALAYDAGREVLVLYGGIGGDGVELADTWEWNGRQWRDRTGPGPGAREAAGMTYDAARGVIVLFGGASGGAMQADTWTWDGANWTEAGSGPPARFPGGLVYDPAREVVWLMGGHAISGGRWQVYGDTWAWDGTTWQELQAAGPSPRDGARAAFDPNSGQVLLFGGAQLEPAVQVLADTWLWDGEQWTELDVPGPPGRLHHMLAYDEMRGRILLAGGAGAGGALLNDAWEWDGEGWRCVSVCGE